MKLFPIVTVLQLGFVLAVSIRAQDALEQLQVNATMDIFRAGGYNDGSDGAAPVGYVFQPRAGQVLVFSRV